MTNVQNYLEDKRIVEWARVVVHTTGPLGPNTPMSDNHWSIYLLLAKNQGSLRLNMRGEWDDVKNMWNTTGILECTTYAYTMTSSRIDSWDYKVPDITVGWICTLLWNKERDAYNMSGGGSGCRWWVLTIIKDLEDQQYVAAGSANDLHPKLLFRYSRSGEKRDLAMVEGEFYPSGRRSTAQQTQSLSSAGKATSSGLGPWSKWTWDDKYNCESRWRVNPAKETGYEWDYRQVVSSEATGSTSEPAGIAGPASGTAGGEAASSGVGPWSKWTWDNKYNCESRWRVNPAKETGYEWDYRQVVSSKAT